MDDLKLIKDKYGENMAHLCRSLFPTILEKEGQLFKIMSENFQYSRDLYKDIIEFNLVDEFEEHIIGIFKKNEREIIDTNKSPFELMEEAGYTLYRCRTEEDIQSFMKYYAPGEELCTFKGGRLNTCDVFFAVKKNVEDIRRENFKNPERQDEYGTSVISIQFSKGPSNYVSIKNRYNHTVKNPDATFSNDLDNIIPGLTISFNKHYGYKMASPKSNFEIQDYVQDINGKYYKYNEEVNNTYYCGNNVVISNHQLQDRFTDKNRYIIFDYFVLDMIKKTVFLYDPSLIGSESFVDTFIENVFDKIYIKKDKDKGTKTITLENSDGKIIIELDKNNGMVSYYDDINKAIGNNFLSCVDNVRYINLPNAELIKSNFLQYGNNVVVDTPKLKTVKDRFMIYAKGAHINAPLLETVGDLFMCANTNAEVSLPSLVSCGEFFCSVNRQVSLVDLPRLKEAGYGFFRDSSIIKHLNLPSIEKMGDMCLAYNREMESFSAPNLIEIGKDFLKSNKTLKKFDVPKLEKVGFRTLEMHQDIIPENVEVEKVKNNIFDKDIENSLSYDGLHQVHETINRGRNI